MGGTTFTSRARGKNATEAFAAAKAKAQYDHGHSGYSGTIAEKDGFVVIPFQGDRAAAQALADELIDKDDPRVRDKWGPAGCIALGDGEFLFFGWASC